MSWNRPNSANAKQEGEKKSFRVPLFLAGAFLAACGLVFIWQIISHTESTSRQSFDLTHKERIKEIGTPVRSPETSNDVGSKTDDSEEYSISKTDSVVAATNGIVSKYNPEGRRFISIVTNNTGMILTTYQRANGSMVEVLDWTKPSHPVTAADQLLNMVISSADGGPPAPIDPTDRSLDDIFVQSISNPVEIKDDDSDLTRALKERLNRAREDMDALMNQTGASFSEIIAEHQRTAKENTAILDEAQSLINDALKKGDKDSAAEIYQQFVSRLEELGVTGLTLDPEADEN